MICFGIDPGVGGGLAGLDVSVPGSTRLVTDRDLLDWFGLHGFQPYAGPNPAAFAVIEKVASSPQMGVVSAFTFGKGYGRLLMALCALRIPYEEVSPGRWQKALSCQTGGDKNVSKRKAEQLFPAVKMTHAIADALLLAEYCRRLRT